VHETEKFMHHNNGTSHESMKSLLL